MCNGQSTYFICGCTITHPALVGCKVVHRSVVHFNDTCSACDVEFNIGIINRQCNKERDQVVKHSRTKKETEQDYHKLGAILRLIESERRRMVEEARQKGRRSLGTVERGGNSVEQEETWEMFTYRGSF